MWPVTRVISPEILSCSTTSQHLYRACFVSSRRKELDVLLIYRACFVSSSLTEQDVLYIYRACFVSLSLKERDLLHALFTKISGDITQHSGRVDLLPGELTSLVSGDITSGETDFWAT